MYLIEYKCGDFIIKKYVADPKQLGELIEANMSNYEYIKILEEIKDELIESKEVEDKQHKKR